MGLDSVELVMEIENYFKISIPDTEAETLATVGQMTNAVAGHLGIDSEESPMRDALFIKIKEYILAGNINAADMNLHDKVLNFLPLHKEAWTAMESYLQTSIPYPDQVSITGKKFSDKIKRFLSWAPMYKTEEITFEHLISAIHANNFREWANVSNIKNKYEIYIAVMGITVDKIGVDYYEITPGKSFTNDLGVD